MLIYIYIYIYAYIYIYIYIYIYMCVCVCAYMYTHIYLSQLKTTGYKVISNMSENRNRLPSDSNYYPTIQEILSAEQSELSTFIGKAKKTTLECLLRETLSQLNQANKEKMINDFAKNSANSFNDIETKITELTKVKKMKVTETERPDTKIEKKTSTSQSKNDEVTPQLRVHGPPEPDASNNDTSFVAQETKK